MKITDGEFTLNDFLRQMQQIKRLGTMQSIMKLIPGFEGIQLPNPTTELKRIEGIIHAMTINERTSPGIIDHNRRRRIAAGSGHRVRDVVLLMRDFEKMRKLMEAMVGVGVRDRMRMVQNTVDFRGDVDVRFDPDRPRR